MVRWTRPEPTYDDEGTKAFFGGTDWRSHDVVGLRAHESSLHFFSPAAFRYYLPAFVIAAVRDPGRADVIPDTILWTLRAAAEATEGSDAERWKLLTTRERFALARFVEWYRDRIYAHPEPYLKERRERRELSAFMAKLEATDSQPA